MAMILTRLIFIVVFCCWKALCCPNGWLGHGNSCYHFSHDKEDWPNAVTICRILGGHLVKVDNAAENQYLVSQAKLLIKTFWIGLNDLQEEGTWMWVDNKTPNINDSYTNWSSKQPDNGASNENCCTIKHTFNYLWNDGQCSILQNYICEKSKEDAEIVG